MAAMKRHSATALFRMKTSNTRMEAPNTKIQATKKSQCPNSNSFRRVGALRLSFEAFLAFDGWLVGFGFCRFASKSAKIDEATAFGSWTATISRDQNDSNGVIVPCLPRGED